MRLTTATAARALGVPAKTFDNAFVRVASQRSVPGKQGRSRQIPYTMVERIAVALVLGRDLGSPLRRSIELADTIILGRGTCRVGPLAALQFDIDALRLSLATAIAQALEETQQPRRGRPTRHQKNRRGTFD